jgi:mono/diheme cytochrome c family protein
MPQNWPQQLSEIKASAAETVARMARETNHHLLTRLNETCAEFARYWRLSLAVTVVASAALAAEPQRGRQLAEEHCGSCHTVGPRQKNEVADSPPFSVIGGKYGFNEAALTAAVIGPHPKMNFTPSPRDAEDIAAYISTLRR